MEERTNSVPDFRGAFNDKRIDKRATSLIEKLVKTRKSTISQISDDFAEQKSYYRLLENTKFHEDVIKDRTFSKCNINATGRNVLALSDTVDFNLDSHKGRIDIQNGFGLSSNVSIGFKLHSCLILDCESYFPLGFSSINIWTREFGSPLKNERDYKNLEIEKKESYKWQQAMNETTENISGADQITFVADRESDIYHFLVQKREASTHFLIRATQKRSTISKQSIQSFLSEKCAKFKYETSIQGDIRKKSETRIATLGVKYEYVNLLKPNKIKDNSLPKSVGVYVIEVLEETDITTKIHWRLYTTHKIETDLDAMRMISWYKARWNIEQVHRLLKKEGLEVEDTQLEKAASIKKLLVLSLSAVLRVLQLNLAYSKETEERVDLIFNKKEQAFLERLNKKSEGETKLLKNPYPREELRWATWIIARLGDWKGYKSQRPPGVITLQKGLARFYYMFDGWLLANDTYG
jgi:hypothetical protein